MASALLSIGLLGAAGAHADGGDGPQRRDPPQHQQGGNQGQGQGQRGDAHQTDPRDARNYEARAEEQRRAMQEAARNAEMSRRAGRMTPDERRDLRRQINEVSQDLYALPPRR